MIWNGALYIGVASIAKEAGFRGSVVVVGAATPEFAPFVRPGSTIQAFGLTAPELTSTIATPVVAIPAT